MELASGRGGWVSEKYQIFQMNEIVNWNWKEREFGIYVSRKVADEYSTAHYTRYSHFANISESEWVVNKANRDVRHSLIVHR